MFVPRVGATVQVLPAPLALALPPAFAPIKLSTITLPVVLISSIPSPKFCLIVLPRIE
jgi:hypothetical protein